MNNLCLIVILYNPSPEIVKKWEIFVNQNSIFDVIIVDNSSKESLNVSLENLIYIPLYSNKGIASAQNVGIKQAFRVDAKYIIFFDQDSEVDESYCTSLLEEYKRVKELIPNLAMLGPTVVNKETGEDYKKGGSANGQRFVKTNTLISSGTIVETETLKEVGLMEDDLFIDAVDFEWCWRAVDKGFVCVRSERIKLPHKVGQKNKTFLGIPFIVSSPFRYYYQYRNLFSLIRRPYVPTKWKIKSSIRRIAELFIIPVLSEKKWMTIRSIFNGIKDGILN